MKKTRRETAFMDSYFALSTRACCVVGFSALALVMTMLCTMGR